jgi:3-hydroxymyristoyl/3-hydroxydecanoyl-(acyl carrier protein) dehydratase
MACYRDSFNRYSLWDNFKGTSKNHSNGNIRNIKFIKQVTPNVNHSLVVKIHHNKQMKAAKYVTSSNQQCSEHKNLYATQLNLHEIADGHEKLLDAEKE